jgi:hypothetical protein
LCPLSIWLLLLKSFCSAARQGHLACIKQVYGYLAKMWTCKLQFSVHQADDFAIPILHHDWTRTIHVNSNELVPIDAPPPLEEDSILTSYFCANQCLDFAMGHSVTGLLRLSNQTVIDFSKKRPLVQNATYGSEYMAARTSTEQIVELLNILRYLGYP